MNKVQLKGKLTELTDLMVNDYGYAERIATVEIVDPDSKSNWTDRVKVKIGGKNAVAKRRINTNVEIIGKCGLFRAGTEDEPQYANVQGYFVEKSDKADHEAH